MSMIHEIAEPKKLVEAAGVRHPAPRDLWQLSGRNRVLKSFYESLRVPFETGMRIEQRYFTEIMQTKEAAAMILFLFVSLQDLNKSARRLKGIAYVTAKAGIPAVLVEREQESTGEDKAHSDSLISEQVKKGRAKAEDCDKLLPLTTPSAYYADLDLIGIFIRSGMLDLARKKRWSQILGELQTLFVREIRLRRRLEVVSSIET